MIIEDYNLVNSKLENIFNRRPSKFIKNGLGVYSNIFYPIGWFSKLNVELGCVNYKASNKTYHIHKIKIKTLLKTYDLDRSLCNLMLATYNINHSIKINEQMVVQREIDRQESVAIRFNRMLQSIL